MERQIVNLERRIYYHDHVNLVMNLNVAILDSWAIAISQFLGLATP